MRNRNFILIILLVLFVFFNILLLILVINKNHETGNKQILLQIYSDSLRNYKNQKDVSIMNSGLIFEFDSEKINSSLLLNEEDGRIVSFGELLTGSPRLVFRYSSLNCNVCVDEQVVLLRRAAKDIGEDNIIILADYNSPRELTQFIRMNQINIKVLNAKNTQFTSIDRSLPYYFILDESMCLKNLFIPVKGDTSLTMEYFKRITERYFR